MWLITEQSESQISFLTGLVRTPGCHLQPSPARLRLRRSPRPSPCLLLPAPWGLRAGPSPVSPSPSSFVGLDLVTSIALFFLKLFLCVLRELL